MIDPVEDELALVRRRYPDAELQDAPEGRLLVLPSVPLSGGGWNRQATPVWVTIPQGYPNVRPDCFFAAGDLRLATNADPASSGIQSIGGISVRWFSWHLTTWDPQRDGLAQYVRFVERRLSEPR